jgi:hypothetical protein
LYYLLLSRKVKVKIYKTIILTVLYECETRPVTLREEHKQKVFENRVLSRIFGPKTNEVMEERRKLHSGELRSLYFSLDVIRQINSRRMRWAGHVARMREDRKFIRFLWESLKERDHSEDRGVDGRMRLEWLPGRLVGGGVWSGFTWLSIGIVGGLL